MFLAAAIILTLAVIGYVVIVREKDLPVPAPAPPYQFLEERKAVIYDSLRDLNFEYRVGKLSDTDYQQSKTELQRELAQILEQIDEMKQAIAPPAVNAKAAKASAGAAGPKPGTVCPHCNAKFPRPLKFCGECGKSMVGESA